MTSSVEHLLTSMYFLIYEEIHISFLMKFLFKSRPFQKSGCHLVEAREVWTLPVEVLVEAGVVGCEFTQVRMKETVVH